MKILIAAACVAVIAATGYYFIQEYRKSAAEAAQAEFTAWRDNCFDTIDNLIAGKGMNKGVMTTCLWRGGQPMKDELNRRLVAAGKNPI